VWWESENGLQEEELVMESRGEEGGAEELSDFKLQA
jgi:hypothetical protein